MTLEREITIDDGETVEAIKENKVLGSLVVIALELQNLALLLAIGLCFKEVIQINFLVCLYRLTLLLLLCLHLTVDLIIVL